MIYIYQVNFGANMPGDKGFLKGQCYRSIKEDLNKIFHGLAIPYDSYLYATTKITDEIILQASSEVGPHEMKISLLGELNL